MGISIPGKDGHYIEIGPSILYNYIDHHYSDPDICRSAIFAAQLMHVSFCCHSNLFWCEMPSEGDGRLMYANLDGTESRQLFHGSENRKRRASDNCNCPQLVVEPVFAVDHSDARNARLFIVDKATSNIWAADMDGCHCRLVVNATRTNLLGKWWSWKLYASRVSPVIYRTQKWSILCLQMA